MSAQSPTVLHVISAMLAKDSVPSAMRERAQALFETLLARWCLSGAEMEDKLIGALVARLHVEVGKLLESPHKAPLGRLALALLALYTDHPEQFASVWGDMSASEQEHLKYVLDNISEKSLERMSPRAWLTARRLTGRWLLARWLDSPQALVDFYAPRIALLDEGDADFLLCLDKVATSIPVSEGLLHRQVESHLADAPSFNRALGVVFFRYHLGLFSDQEVVDMWEVVAQSVRAHPSDKVRLEAMDKLVSLAGRIFNKAALNGEQTGVTRWNRAFLEHLLADWHRYRLSRSTSAYVGLAAHYLENLGIDKHLPFPLGALYLEFVRNGYSPSLRRYQTDDSPFLRLLTQEAGWDLPADEIGYPESIIALSRWDENPVAAFKVFTRGLHGRDVIAAIARKDLSAVADLPVADLTPAQRGVLFAFTASRPDLAPADKSNRLQALLSGLDRAGLARMSSVIREVLTVTNELSSGGEDAEEHSLYTNLRSKRGRDGAVEGIETFNAHAKKIGVPERVVVAGLARRTPAGSRTLDALARQVVEFADDPAQVDASDVYTRFGESVFKLFARIRQSEGQIADDSAARFLDKLPPRWALALSALIYARRLGEADTAERALRRSSVLDKLGEDERRLVSRLCKAETTPLPPHEEIAFRIRAIDFLGYLSGLHKDVYLLPSSDDARAVLGEEQGSEDESCAVLRGSVAEIYAALRRGHMPMRAPSQAQVVVLSSGMRRSV